MNWQAVVENTVNAMGYDLVDCERSPRGLLRVFIDRLDAADPRGPITVDDCEFVTRQLQPVLEVEGCAYERLEVSSPGLDRRLRRPADYERFAGAEVELALKLPFQGRRNYRGVLERDGEGWRLVLPAQGGQPQQALNFALDEVREARLVPVVDFKGRRREVPGQAPAAAAPVEDDDGDHKQ